MHVPVDNVCDEVVVEVLPLEGFALSPQVLPRKVNAN